MRPLTFFIAAALTVSVAACDVAGSKPTEPGGNPYGLTTTGPGVFSVSPLDTGTIFAITPLGKMAPPGHVLPTDHIYLSFVDAWSGQQQTNDCRARPVRAAGAGVIDFIFVTEALGDTKIGVQMTKTFHYYYDHVLARQGMTVGTRVNAGDTIATTTGRCPSMDLGAWDEGITPPGFVNTKRYAGQTLHVVPPLRYFAEPLRTALYNRVRLIDGVPADKDGRTDWGVSGKLVGDWFHTSLPVDASSTGGSPGWDKSVSFAYDFGNHKPLISIGGTIAVPGALNVVNAAPDPATVTVATGLVAYQGTPNVGLIQAGWLLVQMTADDRIRIEYFVGAVTRPVAFTGAAQEYVR